MTLSYLALGFVLITIGLGALLLAAAFWTRHDGRTLLAFGAFVMLYGIGLLARSTLLTPRNSPRGWSTTGRRFRR